MSFDDLHHEVAAERPRDCRRVEVQTVARRNGRAPTWPRRLRDALDRGVADAETAALREMTADKEQADAIEAARLAEIDRLHALARSAQPEGGDACGRS